MDKEEEIILEDDSELENPTVLVKKLREKLKLCQTERQEFLATSQRLKADYINLRKEEEKNRSELAQFAKSGLLVELLDLADTFELAFANREAWEAAPANWRQGVEYIYAKLLDIFNQHGLEKIEPLGALFNPTEHHSVGALEIERAEDDNKVLAVVQSGYKLNGRVIRAAKVKVGHKK